MITPVFAVSPVMIRPSIRMSRPGLQIAFSSGEAPRHWLRQRPLVFRLTHVQPREKIGVVSGVVPCFSTYWINGPEQAATDILAKGVRGEQAMLAESELDDILRFLSFQGFTEQVEGLLKRVVSCPICSELFKRSDELKEHLEKCHPDRLVSLGSKYIADHCVKIGDDKVFICPHCHFAVGYRKDVSVPLPNPTDTIMAHLQGKDQPYHLTTRGGPIALSFHTSEDVILIDSYLRKDAEIALFPCPECDQCYGSAETLAQHLALDHSSACPEDLKDEELQRIRLAAQRQLDCKPAPEVIIPIASAPANRVETTKRPAKAGEAKPPRVPERHRDSAHTSPPLHDTSALIGREFSRTVKQREIDAGFVVLPTRLSSCLGPSSQVTAQLAGSENAPVLSFNPSNRRLTDLTKWFQKSAIEPGDRIKFRLLRVDPPEIQIWTEWEKHLNYLIRCPAVDFKWKRFPIRDCLIKVFADRPGPIHYRSLYSQISKHRDLVVGSVIATLSKYRGVLFAHSGRGMWSWLKDDTRTEDSPTPRPQPSERLDIPEISDAIWKIVAEIEERDVVYRLLKRTRDSLSFVQICQKIAEARGIDWHELQHTGFLKAEDERFTRLDNGHFALREWFDDPVAPRTPTPPVIDDVPEKEPTATTIAKLPDSPRPPIVPKGLLSRVRTVVRHMLGFLVRWVRRKPHG